MSDLHVVNLFTDQSLSPYHRLQRLKSVWLVGQVEKVSIRMQALPCPHLTPVLEFCIILSNPII